MLVAFPSPGARVAESSTAGLPGGPRLPDFGLKGPEPGPRAAADGSEGFHSRFARLLEEQARYREERNDAPRNAAGGSAAQNPRSEAHEVPAGTAVANPGPAEDPGPDARKGTAGSEAAGAGARESRSASRETDDAARRRKAEGSDKKTPREEDEEPQAQLPRRLRGGQASKDGAPARKPGSGGTEPPGAAEGAAGDRRNAGGERLPGGKEAQAGIAEKRGGGKAGRRQGSDDLAAMMAGASGDASRKAAGPGESERREAALRISPARPGLGGLGGEPEGASLKDGGTAGRLAGARGNARLVILDLRDGPAGSGEAAEGKNGTAGKGLAAASEDMRRSPSAAEREFLTLLKSHSAERGDPATPQGGDSQKAAPSLRTFQERLVPEVLRHTGIILREGGSGEIRLLLKPESLGAVRIRLSLGESSLEGRIVVENNTVKDLMEASLEHLKQALRDGGFQSASLEVTVGNRQNGYQAESPAPDARVEGAGSRELEAAVAPLMELISLEPSLINLVV